jgi:hypothetical protein
MLFFLLFPELLLRRTNILYLICVWYDDVDSIKSEKSAHTFFKLNLKEEKKKTTKIW